MYETKTKPSTISDLSLDIKFIVLEYLDNRSLAHFAQTCKYFDMLVRNLLSFRNAEVCTLDHLIPKTPPFLNYRAGVATGSTFYMPFVNKSPFCYTFDFNSGIWSSYKLNLIDMIDIQPQITSAAVIGTKIYLVCGRLVKSYTLTNGLIEIDISNFNTRMINDANGMPPRPRHEHSVDSIGNRYLVVFGGLCYNSVGENDVFVYDTFDNQWFVPPISGHVPHLRFGHASVVTGHNLYIHGGAQLDNDSSYIIYDDLYKLDCQTWVWYKYEHPEVEKYLRNQIPTPGESPQRSHLISTTGASPHDRFQPYMCAYGKKLIIFGGHSIREDEDDNEILCSYSVDRLSIFNTKRRAWSMLSATSIDDKKHQDYLDAEEYEENYDSAITVSDMSVAAVLNGSRGIRVYIFAGRKAAEIPRSNIVRNTDRSSYHSSSKISSSSNGSIQSQADGRQYNQATHFSLPSITETVLPAQSINNDDIENRTESGEMLPANEKSKSKETPQGHIRTPNKTNHSEQVKHLFNREPDLDDMMEEDEYENIVNITKPIATNSNSNNVKNKKRIKRRRSSISVIHADENDNTEFLCYGKNASSSSHSSFSSNGSLGIRNSRYHRIVIPCTILIDLIE